MNTPSERFNLPIIGVITTKKMIYDIEDLNTGSKSEYIMDPDTYEVIEETAILYVTNTWYKDHKDQPLLILKDFVEKFESI